MQRNTRKTTAEFLAEVAAIRDDIDILDEYPQNRHTKISVRCKKCGNVFRLSPKSILYGTQCSNCRVHHNKNSRSFKTFIETLNEKNDGFKNGKYMIIPGQYSDDDIVLTTTRIKSQCNQCGYVWETTTGSLLSNKSGCSQCYNKERRGKHKLLSQQQFLDKLKAKNDYLIPCDQYINERTKIRFICKFCGKIVYMTPQNAFDGHGCFECGVQRRAELRKTDTFDFFKRVLEANPDNWCLGWYAGIRNKVETQCGVCGNIWYPSAASLLNGTGCPICNKSKGERKIETYLKTKEIPYIPQKTFDGLFGIGGGLLLYDFYLPKHNLLIEYQGEFHDGSIRDSYQPPEKKQQQFEHDRRKREYAKQNNIELLEIWYQDFDNIESIIDKKLGDMLEEILEQYNKSSIRRKGD